MSSYQNKKRTYAPGSFVSQPLLIPLSLHKIKNVPTHPSPAPPPPVCRYACLALNLYLSVTRPFTRPADRMGALRPLTSGWVDESSSSHQHWFCDQAPSTPGSGSALRSAALSRRSTTAAGLCTQLADGRHVFLSDCLFVQATGLCTSSAGSQRRATASCGRGSTGRCSEGGLCCTRSCPPSPSHIASGASASVKSVNGVSSRLGAL